MWKIMSILNCHEPGYGQKNEISKVMAKKTNFGKKSNFVFSKLVFLAIT